MRLLITGGGTAGHVYPALSVAEALKEAQRTDFPNEALDLTWVGSVSGLEGDIVRRSDIAFRGVGLRGGLRGVGPLAAVRGVFGLLAGLWQSLGIIRVLRPQVILATGGYVSVPAVLAGWLLRVPSLVYPAGYAAGLGSAFSGAFCAASCRHDRREPYVLPGP